MQELLQESSGELALDELLVLLLDDELVDDELAGDARHDGRRRDDRDARRPSRQVRRTRGGPSAASAAEVLDELAHAGMLPAPLATAGECVLEDALQFGGLLGGQLAARNFAGDQAVDLRLDVAGSGMAA